jgi:hypothetical protein
MGSPVASSSARAFLSAGLGSAGVGRTLGYEATMATRLALAVIFTLTALRPAGATPAASSASTLFSSYDVVTLEVKAPFNDLFDHARTNDAYAVDGTLSFTEAGRSITVDHVKITIRGNTSKRESECTFPKLKLQFPRDAPVEGALFAGRSSIKIGTHCGESADDAVSAKFGRLPNEQSPAREAFVYRLLDAVGVPTLKARPARITYVYTDARAGSIPPEDQPVARNAMLLENAEEAVKRFGGTGEIEEKNFSNARAKFAAADTARLALAEAMIGNFDWCLKMAPDDAYRCDARHPLWNIVAVTMPDGRARPLMYDFDVSGMVTGRHPWFKDVFSDAFVASHAQPEVEVLAQVQRARTLFSRAELDAARAEFVTRKADAYRALEGAALDPAGKSTAKQYLDGFYAAIQSDYAFYRPVVTVAGAKAYSNESRAAACSSKSVIPLGTPVSEPLQKKDTLIQVRLLDALWNWAPPARCPAVQKGPVWIDAGAVSRDFPKNQP